MEETVKVGDNRQPDGTFGPGNLANPNGRPVETTEQKLIKKATKEIIADYKEKLTEALPALSPVLVAKALGGDMVAIKEVHDRVMGKTPLDLNLGGGVLPFTIIIKKGDPIQKIDDATN